MHAPSPSPEGGGGPPPPPPPMAPPVLFFCRQADAAPQCSYSLSNFNAAAQMWDQFYHSKMGSNGARGYKVCYDKSVCDYCALRKQKVDLHEHVKQQMAKWEEILSKQRLALKPKAAAAQQRLQNELTVENALAYMWGSGMNIAPLALPKDMKGLPMQTAAGAQHFIYLTDVGEVWTWGESSYGKLGHGNRVPQSAPKKVEAFKSKNITQVACGEHHSAAVDDAGYVYTWGQSANGRLGHGPSVGDSYEPFAVEALKRKRISSVQCGTRHTLFLTVEGEVYGCGMGAFGASGFVQDRNVPTLMPLPAAIASLSCGLSHTVALSTAGVVYTWGLTSHDRLGVSNLPVNAPHAEPVKIDFAGSPRIVQIAAGSQFSFALSSDGQVWAWGKNDRGQLGIGVTSHTVSHAVALTDTGEVYQWGHGSHTPAKVTVPNLLSFQHLAAGGESTIGLTGVLRSLLGEELGALQSTAEFSDITVVLPRGQRLASHKVILAARCPSLIADLAPDAKEVNLAASEAAAKVLLLYLYTDRVEKLDEEVRKEVAELAIQHKLGRLGAMCGRAVVRVATTLKEDLSRAFKLHLHADIDLVVEEKPIHVHRAILAARCKYFSAMFHSNMKEASQDELPIPDFELPTVQALLNFLYTDELVTEPTVAVDLLALANQYTLPRLKHLCVGVIEKGVDEETICYVYQAARLYDVPLLVNFCKGFIAEHWAQVQKTESFAALSPEEREEVKPAPPPPKTVVSSYTPPRTTPAPRLTLAPPPGKAEKSENQKSKKKQPDYRSKPTPALTAKPTPAAKGTPPDPKKKVPRHKRTLS